MFHFLSPFSKGQWSCFAIVWDRLCYRPGCPDPTWRDLIRITSNCVRWDCVQLATSLETADSQTDIPWDSWKNGEPVAASWQLCSPIASGPGPCWPASAWFWLWWSSSSTWTGPSRTWRMDRWRRRPFWQRPPRDQIGNCCGALLRRRDIAIIRWVL